MLRFAIRAAALLLLIGALVMTVWQPLRWPMLIAPALIALGTFDERRYTGIPASDVLLEPTGERFVDPETGLVNRVFLDPRTGARRYIVEP
jgi:hypothetical protein